MGEERMGDRVGRGDEEREGVGEERKEDRAGRGEDGRQGRERRGR